MTLTLEIPDDLARQLESIPEEERNNYAVALMRKGVETTADEGDEKFDPISPVDPADYPISEEDIASIRRGLEESDAGLSIRGDVFFAEAFARVGLAYPPKTSEK